MTFPRHFDCTYVNTQKYELQLVVVEQLAPLGRQLCEMVVREQLAPRRGASFLLHFRGVSNPLSALGR